MRLFAYIDPVTGSIFIQALIGGFLMISVVSRNYVKKFLTNMLNKTKSIFSRTKNTDENK
jgi:hypothetical protein